MNRELLVLHLTGEKYLLLDEKKINIEDMDLVKYLVHIGVRTKYLVKDEV